MLGTPVTQRLWNLVMDTTPFNNPSSGCIGDKYPQTEISWDDIAEFLNKLEEKTGVRFRLPTSVEWEYAAKEGSRSDINQALSCLFNHKELTIEDKWSKARQLLREKSYPRFSGECAEVTKEDLGIKNHSDLYEVAFYEPNHLGLYDMAGCVCEWCYDVDTEDYYDSRLESDDYKKKGYDLNPSGPNISKGDRVWRGGGWDSDESDCASTYWYSSAQRDKEGNLGFRLVIDLEEYKKL